MTSPATTTQGSSMTHQERDVEAELAALGPEFKAVRLLYPDLHGVARGKDIPRRHFPGMAEEGVMFCAAIMGTDLRHTPVVGGEEGYVDLAIRPVLPLVNDDRVASSVLWKEPLVAVFRRDHPLAHASSLRLHQVASLSLVTIGESRDGHARQFETNLAFANAGLSPTIAVQTNQPQTLVSLVRHGLGVGVTNGLAIRMAVLYLCGGISAP